MRRETRSRLLQKYACVLLPAVCLLGTPAAAQSEAPADLVSAYVEIWNSGDLERLDDIVAPGFRRHAGPDESCRSRAELGQLISRSHEIWKNLMITVDDSMATGDGGAVRGTFSGVHRKTSGIIEFPTMSIFHFEDGKIAEEWIIGDNFLSLMALGFELVPPGFETVPPGSMSGDTPDVTRPAER